MSFSSKQSLKGLKVHVFHRYNILTRETIFLKESLFPCNINLSVNGAIQMEKKKTNDVYENKLSVACF